MREYTGYHTFKYRDSINWELYKTSLAWALLDGAEDHIRTDHPEETDGLISVGSDIQLVGSLEESDNLEYVVKIEFAETE